MVNSPFTLLILSIVGIVTLLSSTTDGFQVSSTMSRPSQKRIALQSAASSSSSEVETTTEAQQQQQQQSTQPTKKKKKRVAILVCPAQFCVPDDYNVLFENLVSNNDDDDDDDDDSTSSSSVEIGTCKVANLPRTEWIKVARQLPTKNFLDATLPVYKTLDWYFDAVEQGLADILATEGPDTTVCIIGHSIGGWVARAYLGGLGKSSRSISDLAKERCSSLITLGTPHISPDTALVDQTRGLLREIADTPSCSSQALVEDLGIDITCVCSSGLAGNFLTTDVEQLVAASSYLPLLGRIGADVAGDGIVPLDLAFMDSPARRVEIEKCTMTGAPVRHSHVLPTPWNLWNGYAPSIVLPPDTFTSYTSVGVIPQWSKYIR